MKRAILSLIMALAASVVFNGCATNRHSVVLGNYKIVYGPMGAVAQRWESVKAAITGWEVVAATDDEEYSVLVLHK